MAAKSSYHWAIAILLLGICLKEIITDVYALYVYNNVHCSITYNNKKWAKVQIPNNKELVKYNIIHFYEGTLFSQEK